MNIQEKEGYMPEIKVGDKVRILKATAPFNERYIGRIGKIRRIILDEETIRYNLGFPQLNSVVFYKGDFEKIKEKED